MTGTSESTTCNLVERLSNALQIEYDPAEFESQMRSALAQTKRKSNSSATGGIAKKANVGSQTIGSMFNAANKWIYTGLKSQKEVKKACKDFGVGFKGVSYFQSYAGLFIFSPRQFTGRLRRHI